MNTKTIFILGCPGSGKSTMCKSLINQCPDLKIIHLSVGDLLRSIRDNPEHNNYSDEVLAIVKKHLPHGKLPTLIPGEILIPYILKPKLEQLKIDTPDFILIDGFPRDPDQAEEAVRVLGKPEAVWNCSCGRETAKERYLKRAREADDEQIFGGRFEEFERKNGSVVERLKEMGCVFESIDLGGEAKASLTLAMSALRRAS